MSSKEVELPPEILHNILDHIEPQRDTANIIERRCFLSVESFDVPRDTSRGSLEDIGKFRCASKRFAEIGAERIFAKVACRFSTQGLRRLDQLADWEHLACKVKRFTYLVPCFFSGASDFDRFEDDLLEHGLRNQDLDGLRAKAQEQQAICTSQEDVRVLKRVIARFTKLQVVQLLRVTDNRDRQLLDYLKQHEEALGYLNLDWTSACSHASQTIGIALLAARNIPWSRFSLPMLSPASAQFLQVNGPNAIPALAERLECLTLHFDDGDNLDAKIQDLSGLFQAVFARAKRMQALHVGFPQNRPLTLPLETVFANVKWSQLKAFGVQAWVLDQDEILGLVRRHRHTLKGLRLRDVHLKEGSLWRNILPVLRDEVHGLKWVSLRRIGYAQSLQSSLNVGSEIPDHPFSDSESTSDEDTDEDERSTAEPLANDEYGANEDNDDSDDDSDSYEDSDDEHGPQANEMDFPNLSSPITQSAAPWCTCGDANRLESAEDLADDGIQVDNAKRKYWERWVLRRCPVHGER